MWFGVLLYLVPLACVAAYDLRTHRAPNVVMLPLIMLTLLASLTLYHEHALEALLGGLVAFCLLLLIALFGRGRMGMGDVKYGIVCGIAVGLRGALPMLAFAFIAGAVVAFLALSLRLQKGSDSVAFTPFLFLGVIFSLTWSRPYLIA